MSQKINESLDLQSVARILNLPVPVGGSEPARLTELNNAVAALNAALAGFNFIENPAVAVMTTNVNIASPGATFDGVAPVSGDPLDGLLLLTGQTTNTENGLWIWHGPTSALTRAVYALNGGSVVAVGPLGGANKNTLWLQTTDDVVVGTTAVTFTQFGATYSAGTGLTLTGNVFSLTSPVAVANGGTNATTAAGARTNLGTPGQYSADFGDGASTTFAITHNLNNSYPVVVVYNKGTGAREDCAVVSNSANQVTLSAEAWTAAAPANNAYRVTVIG